MPALALTLFINLAEIIIVAAIVSAVMRKLKQPTLFAYIVAGIILGPLLLGSVDFTTIGISFPIGIQQVTPEIMLLSELGAAFLLFSIGIDTSVKQLIKTGKPLFFFTLIQVLLVILFTIVLTIPTHLLTLEQGVFVGTIIAFSSTMIIVKLLADKKELNTLSGRVMVTILLIQDFLVIIFVPILANITQATNLSAIGIILGKSVLLILIALIANKLIFPSLFRAATKEHEVFFLSSLAIAFAFIGLGFILDIPITISAFIGGLALSTLPYNLEIVAKVRALRDFFLTIFFVSLGAQLSFSFSALPIALMVIIIALIFVIKPIILFFVSLFAGYGSKIGVKTGLCLAQISEFGFVLAGIGAVTLDAAGKPVIGQELLSFLIGVIAISMIITPYLVNSSSKVVQVFNKRVERLPKGLRRAAFERKLLELQRIPTKKALKNHIIIVGGGTIGRGITRLLNKEHQIIVLDYDPEVVKQGQEDGLPYTYGTSNNETLWDRLDIVDAKLVVITIPNHEEGLEITKQVKKINPKVVVFAKAHYFWETLDYYKNGADFVLMSGVVGSNMFLKTISSFLETGKKPSTKSLSNEYFDYLEEEVKEEKKYRRGVVY